MNSTATPLRSLPIPAAPMGHVSALFAAARQACVRRSARCASLAALASAALLSGCYVVPVQPPSAPTHTTIYTPAPPAPPALPVPVTFAARLYPVNDLAQPFGMVGAVVTNDLNGRGYFTTTINGESFNGEATRVQGSVREGVANGAGNRGNYIRCRYTMNSNTQGAGKCTLSGGAEFTMHVGG